MTSRLDHLQNVCQTTLSTTSDPERNEHHDEHDRRYNIVIFGVPEN